MTVLFVLYRHRSLSLDGYRWFLIVVAISMVYGGISLRTKTMTRNDADDDGNDRSADSPAIDARRDPSAVAKRLHRALDNLFHVEAVNASGEYRVHSESGNTYTVNLPAGTCTCPDGQRGPWCKHAYRVLFQTGELPAVVGTGVVADESAEADDEPPTNEDSNNDHDTLTARASNASRQTTPVRPQLKP